MESGEGDRPTSPPAVSSGPPAVSSGTPAEEVAEATPPATVAPLDLGLADQELRDLFQIVQLSQEYTPASFARETADGRGLFAVSLAHSGAFENRLRDAWASRGGLAGGPGPGLYGALEAARGVLRELHLRSGSPDLPARRRERPPARHPPGTAGAPAGERAGPRIRGPARADRALRRTRHLLERSPDHPAVLLNRVARICWLQSLSRVCLALPSSPFISPGRRALAPRAPADSRPSDNGTPWAGCTGRPALSAVCADAGAPKAYGQTVGAAAGSRSRSCGAIGSRRGGRMKAGLPAAPRGGGGPGSTCTAPPGLRRRLR